MQSHQVSDILAGALAPITYQVAGLRLPASISPIPSGETEGLHSGHFGMPFAPVRDLRSLLVRNAKAPVALQPLFPW